MDSDAVAIPGQLRSSARQPSTITAYGFQRGKRPACTDAVHDWSPTTPSAGTAAQRRKARTEAAVAEPKVPSMPCGETPTGTHLASEWSAGIGRRRPRAPGDGSGSGAPLGRAAQVRGPTTSSAARRARSSGRAGPGQAHRCAGRRGVAPRAEKPLAALLGRPRLDLHRCSARPLGA